MNPSEGQEEPTSPPCGLRAKLCVTFGPVLIGLLGGSMAGVLGPALFARVPRNMATVYDSFPSLERPWLALHLEVSEWWSAIAPPLGLAAAAVIMGLGTVWLARPRDAWADLSAGLTTSLASTIAAFVSFVGWAFAWGFVVLPSIDDLNSLADAFDNPPSAEHRSQPLVDRYADLENVADDGRARKLLGKIVTDQMVGSLRAAWTGMAISFVSFGALALTGTLAAGFVWRRGGCFFKNAADYLGVTLFPPITLGLACITMFSTCSVMNICATIFMLGVTTLFFLWRIIGPVCRTGLS
jgi:hypothetical protein